MDQVVRDIYRFCADYFYDFFKGLFVMSGTHNYQLCLGSFYFCREKNGILGQILEFKILRKIGVWSYSIYLTHWIIFKIMEDFFRYILEVNPKSPMGFYAIIINVIGLMITIYVSRYSYIYIEKKYRDRVKLQISRYKNG
jgi:peptidoglycan/LPS O-acetylase OafA/YrhL